MKFEHAIALFAIMSLDRQESVERVFDLTRFAFDDVREAFAEAVSDQVTAIETEAFLDMRRAKERVQ
jgi:hypothetical protein